MIISVISGGFDPLHSGHLAYIKEAATYGDLLIVCLNSDEWLTSKKGKPFMAFKERKEILESLEVVGRVISFDDSDGSCIDGLQSIQKEFPKSKIIFCNGGDRTATNIPEKNLPGIDFIFGVGGKDKKNSSSDILQNWQFNSEKRSWGSFKTLLSKNNLKLKELVVFPRQGMSFQRHKHRSEIWFISEGRCVVYLQSSKESQHKKIELKKEDFIHVPLMSKHQIINPYDVPCSIIEIQYGLRVNEDDIERFFYYPETP